MSYGAYVQYCTVLVWGMSKQTRISKWCRMGWCVCVCVLGMNVERVICEFWMKLVTTAAHRCEFSEMSDDAKFVKKNEWRRKRTHLCAAQIIWVTTQRMNTHKFGKWVTAQRTFVVYLLQLQMSDDATHAHTKNEKNEWRRNAHLLRTVSKMSDGATHSPRKMIKMIDGATHICSVLYCTFKWVTAQRMQMSNGAHLLLYVLFSIWVTRRKCTLLYCTERKKMTAQLLIK